MRRLVLILLALALTGAPVYGDELQDGFDAARRGDFKTAFKIFKPLAEQGNARAQAYLGVAYGGGIGIPQDDKEALRWYRKAAEQGNNAAQFLISNMYQLGEGVPQDDKEAIKWYRKSAEQGHSGAQLLIGNMYEKGMGVLSDYVEAHKWFNIAGANGLEDGRKNRDILEKRMTPDQIAEAQKLAREWKEEHQNN